MTWPRLFVRFAQEHLVPQAGGVALVAALVLQSAGVAEAQGVKKGKGGAGSTPGSGMSMPAMDGGGVRGGAGSMPGMRM
ncbi:MAG: hypothetical protein JSS02_35450, partial [Planctomycetes bacterium]|nr:hypothetical protein [Planctomycetota bacterium]